jgi:hypothetical protein
MAAYRQWMNGVRRRAAVRWRWHEFERALSSARARRLARIIAVLVLATVIVATIGMAARLVDARVDVNHAVSASPTPVAALALSRSAPSPAP